jgi:hypothetical protein
MNTKELSLIKKYQREFKKLFNKELVIDFLAMNGIQKKPMVVVMQKFNKAEADKILIKECKKYKADINIIKDRKEKLAFKYPNETRAVANYVKECLKENWSVKAIMLHINRERSNAYYYMKKFTK